MVNGLGILMKFADGLNAHWEMELVFEQGFGAEPSIGTEMDKASIFPESERTKNNFMISNLPRSRRLSVLTLKKLRPELFYPIPDSKSIFLASQNYAAGPLAHIQ